VRRDGNHLQVGVDLPARVILPDTPDVRRLLVALEAGQRPAPESPQAALAWRHLVDAGLVVDHAEPSELPLFTVNANAVTRERVARLLRSVGADVADGTARTSAHLVIEDGEISRERLDPLVRDGTPHLVVGVSGGDVVVGPFVDPGRSPCQRCVDAHLTEADPRRPVVVEQLAQLGVTRPLTSLLDAMMLTWAVRDLMTYVAGDTPSTWGATYRWGAQPAPERREWTRHPHCGCGWADALADTPAS